MWGSGPQFLLAAVSVLKVDIRADTNRDGVVDIDGTTDIDGKTTWNESRGAIFLPNIVDTDQRCSVLLSDRSTNQQLSSCNDAADDILRSSQYLAPVRTVPLPDLTQEAHGTVSVPDKAVETLVRIFHRQGDNWGFVTAKTTFSSDDLRKGLELGIDARDARRPEGWDGRVTVQLSVTDGNDTAQDAVMLRVAPVLTHYHAQAARQLVSVQPPQELTFNDEVAAAAKNAGITAPLHLLPAAQRGGMNYTDVWTQDFFEPGYTSMPGPNGSAIALRIMIRSTQDDRPAGRLTFTHLRNGSIGAIQQLGNPNGTFDSMGNLEAIPPYNHNGKKYPAGRIFVGGDLNTGDTSHIYPFLKAQESQDPVLLDTAWLMVGHVDEFIQFLPFPNERGWVIMVADPLSGLALLESAKEQGHGSMPAFSRKNTTTVTNVPGQTIDQLLQQEGFVSGNKEFGRRIENNLDILKNETGMDEEDIHRLPALWQNFTIPNLTSSHNTGQADLFLSYTPSIIMHAGASLQKGQMTRPGRAVAYYPSMVNGVVLSNSQVIMAKPWGPIIDGVDIFEDAARDVYGQIGYNITFVNDWGYYSGLGDVHCGTNTLRDVSVPWW